MQKVKMKVMISSDRLVFKHLWMTCVNYYGYPRPSSVISRTPSDRRGRKTPGYILSIPPCSVWWQWVVFTESRFSDELAYRDATRYSVLVNEALFRHSMNEIATEFSKPPFEFWIIFPITSRNLEWRMIKEALDKLYIIKRTKRLLAS